MGINIWHVVIASVLAMGLGGLWYGPVLFGRQWMKVIGIDENDHEKIKQGQREAGPLYTIQFVLVLIQTALLSVLLRDTFHISTLVYVILAWAAFVIPTLAGSVMWTNDTKEIKWLRFWIQAGYQFVLFIMFGIVLSW